MTDWFLFLMLVAVVSGILGGSLIRPRPVPPPAPLDPDPTRDKTGAEHVHVVLMSSDVCLECGERVGNGR